jgi:hypothetical protein
MRAISIAHRLPKQSSKEGRANHFFGEQGPPQLFPIQDVDFKQVEGSFGWRADAPFVFWEEAMGHLTLREALASRQLDAFVREQQDHGAELVTGSHHGDFSGSSKGSRRRAALSPLPIKITNRGPVAPLASTLVCTLSLLPPIAGSFQSGSSIEEASIRLRLRATLNPNPSSLQCYIVLLGC